MQEKEFRIKGMHCASCVSVIERSVKKQKGVENISVNLALENASVKYDPALINEKDIEKVIESRGYKVMKDSDNRDARKEAFLKFIFALAFTLPVFILSMFIAAGTIPYQAYIIWVLATPVQFITGFEFYKKTFDALKSFSASMDTLVALGTSAAYFYSVYLILAGHGHHLYFETSCVLITVILLGRYLEAAAKKKAADSIQKLIDFAPKTAVVIRNGKEETIIINEIEKGDIIVLKPGDKAAVDGIITQGESSIDESIVTGESMPAAKKPGDKVLAGSINKEGVLQFRAEKVGLETTLAQMIVLVERAQSSKPPVQKLADTVSSYFVPAVIIIAAVTFIAWIITGNPFETALSAAVAVLVVACPCALGLATPAAVIVASGLAAKSGILVRDASALELAGKAKNVVFDKTGTITEGKPVITDLDTFGDKQVKKEDVINIFYYMEKNSGHPLALAIVENITGKITGNLNLTVEDFKNFPGRGVEGIIDGKKYYIGNMKFIEGVGADTAGCAGKIMEMEQSGKTLMILSDGKNCLGFAAAQDLVKKDSSEAVKLLKEMGITVHIVTGDNERTAAAAGRQTGIVNITAAVMPEGKIKAVENLKKNGVVIFAGDGINDAPALASADVGAAFASGADIASEAGNVVLMKNSPLDIVKLIQISRLTVKKVKQNLFWAFIYNIVGIPVAALGLLNPMIAGSAMAFSSVSVLLNSLSMQRSQRKKMRS